MMYTKNTSLRLWLEQLIFEGAHFIRTKTGEKQ